MSSKLGIFTRASSRLSRDLSLPWMLEFPRMVHIVPTTHCNLQCRACPKNVSDDKPMHMHRDIYERVRGQVFGRARTVHLQGLGEPALSPLFSEMIDDAVRGDVALSFVTNASLLEDEQIRKLASARAGVTISLDGARAETHEFSRTGSDFEQVLDALRRLRDARRRRSDSPMTLHLSTVVTRRNVAELADIVRLGKRFEVDSIVFIRPGVGSRDDPFALDCISHHEALYRSHLPAILKAAEETGMLIDLPPLVPQESPSEGGEEEARGEAPRSPLSRLRGLAGKRRIFPGRCAAPWSEMYIDVDGWVRPCCMAMGIAMGNVMSQSLKAIWNNRQYRRLRRSIHSNNPPAFCRDCVLPTGITKGNERFVEQILAQGHPPLPEPPRIGMYWSESENKICEY